MNDNQNKTGALPAGFRHHRYPNFTPKVAPKRITLMEFLIAVGCAIGGCLVAVLVIIGSILLAALPYIVAGLAVWWLLHHFCHVL